MKDPKRQRIIWRDLEFWSAAEFNGFVHTTDQGAYVGKGSSKLMYLSWIVIADEQAHTHTNESDQSTTSCIGHW